MNTASMTEGRKKKNLETWVAQSVKHLILDFGLGHDLTVCEFEPRIGFSTVSTELASDPLFPPPALSAPPPCFLSLKNK